MKFTAKLAENCCKTTGAGIPITETEQPQGFRAKRTAQNWLQNDNSAASHSLGMPTFYENSHLYSGDDIGTAD